MQVATTGMYEVLTNSPVTSLQEKLPGQKGCAAAPSSVLQDSAGSGLFGSRGLGISFASFFGEIQRNSFSLRRLSLNST